MQAIEKEADSSGLTYEMMMENAGQDWRMWSLTCSLMRSSPKPSGLVGPGNNGGDTLVALTALALEGWKARAYLVKRKKDALVKRFTDAGGEILWWQGWLRSTCRVHRGCRRTARWGAWHRDRTAVEKDIAELLSEVNDILDSLEEDAPLVIAVDCPSGVDCDSGEVAEETIPADLTVTMAAVKQGLVRLPAFEYAGELEVVDIGLPDDLPSIQCGHHRSRRSGSRSRRYLPERPLESHKGTFGTALIAAGSVNYTGAAVLAGEAAYRAGAGLVTLAVPGLLHGVLAGPIPRSHLGPAPA
ncbi:MAG: hypothetical protein M0C28_28785 [Candidatus Moduliflexus flocculans]|nr:hypothetical protein [Candidatus Moduliflexus flocculans]